MSYRGKFTNVARIIAKFKRDVDSDKLTKNDIIEWIGEAMEFLQVDGLYENTVDFVLVKGGYAQIPMGLYQLNMIAKDNSWTGCESICTKEYIEEVVGDSGKCEYKQGIQLNCYNQFKESEYVAYFRPSVRIAFNEALDFLTKNRRIQQRFGPLRPTNNMMYQGISCNPELGSANGEYSVQSDGRIKFGFDEGQVAISYVKVATDKNGYPLIPDNQSFVTAVTAYITFKVTEGQFYNYVPNSLSRYVRAEAQWQWYCRQAKNEALMPDVNDAEDIREMGSNFFRPENVFGNYFSNISDMESFGYGSSDEHIIGNNDTYGN